MNHIEAYGRLTLLFNFGQTNQNYSSYCQTKSVGGQGLHMEPCITSKFKKNKNKSEEENNISQNCYLSLTSPTHTPVSPRFYRKWSSLSICSDYWLWLTRGKGYALHYRFFFIPGGEPAKCLCKCLRFPKDSP